MTDTQPMTPTDAELDELRQANGGKLNFVTFSEFRTIARAALAKWGSQPVAREPLTEAQINAAGKKMAECMEYPWAHMPEQGRAEMRKHAQAVIEAANSIKGGQHE